MIRDSGRRRRGSLCPPSVLGFRLGAGVRDRGEPSFAGRPSITALQLVRAGDGSVLGYLGADFDLRNLPLTAELYEEPSHWRQVKGDPAIRGGVFQQCRIESPMDRSLEQSLSILEELLTERGVFQCLIHFSSSQATVWTVNDPFRYRLLDHEALSDADVCLVYPQTPYPLDAAIPQQCVPALLAALGPLRLTDETFYLRMVRSISSTA